MALTNQQIAQKLRQHATELAKAGSNLYRVRAFRSAAMAVLGLPSEVAELVAKGDTRVLERTPGIGKSLAETIARYCAGLPTAKPTPDERQPRTDTWATAS